MCCHKFPSYHPFVTWNVTTNHNAAIVPCLSVQCCSLSFSMPYHIVLVNHRHPMWCQWFDNERLKPVWNSDSKNQLLVLYPVDALFLRQCYHLKTMKYLHQTKFLTFGLNLTESCSIPKSHVCTVNNNDQRTATAVGFNNRHTAAVLFQRWSICQYTTEIRPNSVLLLRPE